MRREAWGDRHEQPVDTEAFPPMATRCFTRVPNGGADFGQNDSFVVREVHGKEFDYVS
jgi:hypothetical protein